MFVFPSINCDLGYKPAKRVGNIFAGNNWIGSIFSVYGGKDYAYFYDKDMAAHWQKVCDGQFNNGNRIFLKNVGLVRISACVGEDSNSQ